MKPKKSHEKDIAEYVTELNGDSFYVQNPNWRRDALLSTIAVELAVIADILEGRNADVKAENRTDA